jgi:hypothetical protein
MVSGDLSLSEEVVLLGLSAPRRRLRLALEAAYRSDGRKATVRRALRSLEQRGLVRRSSWRRWEACESAELAAIRFQVAETVWRPRGAAPREVDLAVLALAVGALSPGQRRSARGLLVGLRDTPPATAWLRDVRALETTAQLADQLLRETAPSPTFEEGAFDPGPTDGIAAGPGL